MFREYGPLTAARRPDAGCAARRPGSQHPRHDVRDSGIDPERRDDDFVQEFRRITMDPDVMGGKPCVRGMRVTVGMIVEALSAGRTNEQLLS